MYIHTYICTCTRTYVHTHVHMYIHTYICTYTRTKVLIHTYIEIHACMHTYIHIHIHTYQITHKTHLNTHRQKNGSHPDSLRLSIVLSHTLSAAIAWCMCLFVFVCMVSLVQTIDHAHCRLGTAAACTYLCVYVLPDSLRASDYQSCSATRLTLQVRSESCSATA